MPDQKKTEGEPTPGERNGVFAPHESPTQQGDGDPGEQAQPSIDDGDADESSGAEDETCKTGGRHGQWY